MPCQQADHLNNIIIVIMITAGAVIKIVGGAGITVDIIDNVIIVIGLWLRSGGCCLHERPGFFFLPHLLRLASIDIRN